MSKKLKSAQLGLRVKPETKKRLKEEAKTRHLSLSQYLALLISHRRFVVEKMDSGDIVIPEDI